MVYSLQEMGSPVHVGGRSALDLQGMAHYLPPGGIQTVELYGVNKLPDWLNDLQLPVKLVAGGMGGIYKLPSDAITTRPFGHWDWQLRFSTRHRHAWQNKLNTDNVDLGSGKRMIVKGGALDKTYAITVPRSMAGKQDAENVF